MKKQFVKKITAIQKNQTLNPLTKEELRHLKGGDIVTVDIIDD